MPHSRALVPMLLAVLLLAGCGGGGGGGHDDTSGDPTPAPTPLATPVATAVATPAPTPTAAAGTLNASFGDGGIVLVGEVRDARVPRHGLRVLADGSVEALVLKQSVLTARTEVSLLRVTSDGHDDGQQAFATTGGVEAASFGANGDVWVGEVAGARATLRHIARDGAAASDDVLTPLGLSSVNDIVPLANGGVLVAGNTLHRGALQRAQADGTLDRTFGDDGLVVDPHGPDALDATLLTAGVGTNGRIVAVGNQFAGPLHPGFAVVFGFAVAYDATGTPDATFGMGGLAAVTNGGVPNAQFAAIAAAADGSAIVATSADVARLDPTGKRDVAFTTRTGLAQGETALVTDANGDITVGGTTFVGDDLVATLTRLHADGTPDSRFGNSGTAIADFPALNDTTGAVFSAVALAPPGAITVAGNALRLPSSSTIVVARYLDLAD